MYCYDITLRCSRVANQTASIFVALGLILDGIFSVLVWLAFLNLL